MTCIASDRSDGEHLMHIKIVSFMYEITKLIMLKLVPLDPWWLNVIAKIEHILLKTNLNTFDLAYGRCQTK